MWTTEFVESFHSNLGAISQCGNGKFMECTGCVLSDNLLLTDDSHPLLKLLWGCKTVSIKFFYKFDISLAYLSLMRSLTCIFQWAHDRMLSIHAIFCEKNVFILAIAYWSDIVLSGQARWLWPWEQFVIYTISWRRRNFSTITAPSVTSCASPQYLS